MTIITADDVKFRLESGEKLNLVDVREPHENAEFNIGGLLLPLGRVQTLQLDDIENLKDEELIVYCRSGNRSGQACQVLDMAGFKNTKNLVGGMLHWRETFKV